MRHVHRSVDGATIDVGVGVVDAPEDLSAIREPGCAAVIWRRQPLPRFQDWIDRLAPAQLPTARLTLRTDAIHDAVQQVCYAAGMSEGPERTWLVDDIAALGAVFGSLMAAPFVRLRLDVIETNACRKFHIDSVTARLVCTYRGTGTQYGISMDGAEPTRVFTVPTGAPIVLRGTRWPGDPQSSLLHRSPPIEGTSETRLLLVFDPVIDPEDDY
ncbi:MAG: DUF1826 domain-containing protein [Pseudomonadota bacterium]